MIHGSHGEPAEWDLTLVSVRAPRVYGGSDGHHRSWSRRRNPCAQAVAVGSVFPTAAYVYEVQAYQAVARFHPSPTTIRNLSYSPE